jgi:hypothetical protein
MKIPAGAAAPIPEAAPTTGAERGFLDYGTVFPVPEAPQLLEGPSEPAASLGEDDTSFLEAFPGMYLAPPGDPHSIVIGERVRLLQTYQILARAAQAARRAGVDPADARRRALHGFYAQAYDLDPKNYERDFGWLRASAREAREAVHVILGYVPSSRRHSFEMNAEVERCTDPVELLRFCGVSGKGILAAHARFEAGRQLVLAQLAFEFRLHRMGPEDVDRRHDWLSAVLTEKYFTRRRSADVGLAVLRDPDDQHRVRRVRVCNRADVQKGEGFDEFPVRIVTYGGRTFPVLYRHRAKNNPILKLVAKRQRDPRLIQDGDGIKLVFLNWRDLQDGVDHLRRTVVRQPGTVFAQKSNLRAAGVVDRTNKHSSHQFRADKYEVLFGGGFVEVQFMLIADYLNEIGSDGAEHHDRYKAGQHLKKVFPRFFPAPLYPSDDPALMESMLRAVAAKIRLSFLSRSGGIFLDA